MRTWLRKKVNPIVPLYTLFPAALCVFVNFLAYYGSRTLMKDARHYDLTTVADRFIPFHPGWVIVYLGSFAFWVVGYCMVAKQGKEHWYRFVLTDIMAKIICGICFFILPTTNVRPEITGDGIFERLMIMVYNMDAPTELFPSIHCLESWLCYIGVRGQKKAPEWYRSFACVFAVMVFASTQFTKQHYLVDMAGALLIAEGCWFLAQRTNLYRPLLLAGEWVTHLLFGSEEEGNGK